MNNETRTRKKVLTDEQEYNLKHNFHIFSVSEWSEVFKVPRSAILKVARENNLNNIIK